jgi:hypothetical protein
MTPAAPAFAPGSVRAFTVGARTADWRTGVVRLGYALDDLPFTETFTFPVRDLPPRRARAPTPSIPPSSCCTWSPA